MIASTMRERARFNTAPREAVTKCLPFSTETELNEFLLTQNSTWLEDSRGLRKKEENISKIKKLG